jgi:hypothetical protein
MVVNWPASGAPQVVAGLSNGAVEYYNGSNWIQLQGLGWNSDVNCMEVNWSVSGNPQVVVGLGDGSVQFYDSSGWTQLQGTGWGSAIDCLSAYWSMVTLSDNSAP